MLREPRMVILGSGEEEEDIFDEMELSGRFLYLDELLKR